MELITKPKFLIGVIVTVGALLAGSVRAESAENYSPRTHPVLTDKWMFWAGGFFPSLDSRLRMDSDMGSPGSGLDFEDELGLSENKTVLWGGARWHMAQRHQLEIEFNNLRRSGFNGFTLEDYQIGDQRVDASGSIATTFNVFLARLTYGYSLIKDEKQDLALKAGFHFTNADASLQLAGDVTDVDTGMTLCSPAPCISPLLETSEFTFPLPHFGLAYGYAFTPKFALRTQALAFYIVINDIKGALFELDFDLHYQPWKKFGLGAGLRYFRVSVDDERDKLFRGKFVFEYWGPVIYATVSF